MSHAILQIRSNGQITLPRSIRHQANLKEGDTLEVLIEQDGTLRLVPKVIVDRNQAYFWTSRWQKGEQEAEADIEAGRVSHFDDVEEALDFLDSPD